MTRSKNKLLATSIAASLGVAIIPALVSATSADGQVRLSTEISTSLAMKIASPNDTNPDCMVQSGVTYGEANRYATSNGAEGSKQVDTFDGTVGGADELNSNTSCATLTMNPNVYDSTYSDITIYTNSPTGYSLTVRSADNTSPNLIKTNNDGTTDPNEYILAGTLTEQDGTGSQAGQKVVPGGQNKWAIKSDNGLLDTWTAMSTTDTTVRSYDQETSGGSTTRVTYGISTGNNPTGKYATTLTYTATMFDDTNPYVPTLDISDGSAGGSGGSGEGGIPEGATISGDTVKGNKLTVPYKATRSFTITPKEGYYLTSFTCPEGYTCTGYTTGTASNPNATSRQAQTIIVTNNSTTSNGAMNFTMGNTYRISFSKSNISSPSTSYIDVPYGSSTTVTITPASGYYLSGFSGFSSGWTCSGVSTGTSRTGAQTLTLTNNSSTNTGTLSISGAESSPFDINCSTTVGSTCTVAGVQYIRLADGHLWTKYSQASTTWKNAASYCPSDTHLPSATEFDTLISYYGGSLNPDYGWYGYYTNSTALYSATGWNGNYWSSTNYENNFNYGTDWAYYLYIYSNSPAYVYYGGGTKTSSLNVVCIR